MTSSEISVYLSVVALTGFVKAMTEDIFIPCELVSYGNHNDAVIKFLSLRPSESERLKRILMNGFGASRFSGLPANYFRFLTRPDPTHLDYDLLTASPPIKHVVQVSSNTRYRKHHKVTTKVYKTVRPDAN
jgi:hypothetical protein